MVYDLQKPDFWKRISAWLFDGILTGIIAVGLALLLSAVLGYDGYNDRLLNAYADYEAQYQVTFDISQEAYIRMTPEQRDNYDAAYAALISDTDAMHSYNMVVNLTMVITTFGILLALLTWEFVIPLILGNGQTLGKKIFNLCLVRTDGVRINHMQLFTRTILGKFAVETMIPVYIVLMIFWGTMGATGTLVLAALAIAQVAVYAFTKTNSLIHDLLAGTAVADFTSQMIFNSTEDLIAYQKKIHAERAARQDY